MYTIPFTRKSISATKNRLRTNLGIKSSHLSEALACGLGAGSHIGLISSFQADTTVRVLEIDAERFVQRLASLGHAPDQDHARMAFYHAINAHHRSYRTGTVEALMGTAAGRICKGKSDLHNFAVWGEDVGFYQDAPDPTIKTVRIDRDVWRWHPIFVASLAAEELEFLIFTIEMHRRLGHPSRRGARDPRAWNIACELVVSHVAVAAQVGAPLRGIHYDEKFHGGLSAEEVYEKITSADDGRLRLNPTIEQGSWHMLKKQWPSTASDLGATVRSRGFRGDALGFMGLGHSERIPKEVRTAVATGRDLIRSVAVSPSSSAMRLIREIDVTIRDAVRLSTVDAAAVIASSPDLMALPTTGGDFRQSIEASLRDIVLANLIDEADEAVSKLWRPTIIAIVVKAMDCTQGIGKWSRDDAESLLGPGLVDDLIENRHVSRLMLLKRKIADLFRPSMKPRSGDEPVSDGQGKPPSILKELQEDIEVLAAWRPKPIKIRAFRAHSGLPPEFFSI